ncbi:hypothetical protein C9I98_02185 [Photobacterium sanctipauli]|uniref:Uncharacterized protein n=1 Tax=Photobacterium sanctipauli TaxID=1342794 RepID=A0A2T3P0Q1_9GAMM|nr:hypothetical protein [Photobacterium sanctipauli]PSW22095.1 hypothetical protein C9I98_02185 [Photobacterium sanctipauli]
MLSNKINALVDKAIMEGDIKAKAAIEKIRRNATFEDEPLPAVKPSKSLNQMMATIDFQSSQLAQKAKRTATLIALLPFLLFLLSLLTT